MKEESKKEIKKGILAGAGTASGAVIGAIVENKINATDVEGNDIQDAESVEAIVEDFDETNEVDLSTTEPNSDTSETIVSETISHIQHPERKPTHQHADILYGQTSEDEEDLFVEAESMIEAEIESEVALVEEPDLDEDIMVVSVAPEESDDDETNTYNETTNTIEIAATLDDGAFPPDYADMKDNNLSVGISITSALDMPDYVNDANIDSFTDNV